MYGLARCARWMGKRQPTAAVPGAAATTIRVAARERAFAGIISFRRRRRLRAAAAANPNGYESDGQEAVSVFKPEYAIEIKDGQFSGGAARAHFLEQGFEFDAHALCAAQPSAAMCQLRSELASEEQQNATESSPPFGGLSLRTPHCWLCQPPRARGAGSAKQAAKKQRRRRMYPPQPPPPRAAAVEPLPGAAAVAAALVSGTTSTSASASGWRLLVCRAKRPSQRTDFEPVRRVAAATALPCTVPFACLFVSQSCLPN